MVCVICLFSGCGIRRNVKQSENYSHEDSAYWVCNDSLLLQKHSILRDSLSWEVKRIEYLPPDSSGRQYLQSVAIARLLHSGSRTDSLTARSSSQQSYSTRMVEQVYTQKDRSVISRRAIFWFTVSVCLLIMGIIYVRRKRFLYNMYCNLFRRTWENTICNLGYITRNSSTNNLFVTSYFCNMKNN